MDQTPFQRACAVAGGSSALARLLRKPKQTVNHYRARVPEDVCPQIELATGVRCEELRADVRWVRVPDEGWPNGKPLLDVTPSAFPAAEHAAQEG